MTKDEEAGNDEGVVLEEGIRNLQTRYRTPFSGYFWDFTANDERSCEGKLEVIFGDVVYVEGGLDER